MCVVTPCLMSHTEIDVIVSHCFMLSRGFWQMVGWWSCCTFTPWEDQEINLRCALHLKCFHTFMKLIMWKCFEGWRNCDEKVMSGKASDWRSVKCFRFKLGKEGGNPDWSLSARAMQTPSVTLSNVAKAPILMITWLRVPSVAFSKLWVLYTTLYHFISDKLQYMCSQSPTMLTTVHVT